MYDTMTEDNMMMYMRLSTQGALRMRDAIRDARRNARIQSNASDYSVCLAGLRGARRYYRAILAMNVSRAALDGARREYAYHRRELRYYSVRSHTSYGLD